MSSSLLRAGMAAIRDRSLGAVAALMGGAVAGTHAHTFDDSPLLPPGTGTGSSWSFVHPRAGWSLDSISDVRRLLFWAVACILLLILLAVTNPTEVSFRAHLTELAFRRHLAHIRSSDEPEAASGGSGTGTPDGTRNATALNGSPTISGSSSSSGADTPPIAPFRFANHVAITLRTPHLCYRSYFFFAIAFAAAPGPPAFLSDPVSAKSSKNSAGAGSQPELSLAYLGVLGHWLALGQVPPVLQWAWRAVRVGRRDRARKRSAALDRPGVLEMRAVLPKDENAPPSARTSGLVPKILFKNESHKDLADLLPLHSTPSTLPAGGSFGTESRSRRGSVVNLIATPPTPINAPEGPAIEVSSPILTALKAELAAAQSVLADLQAQLTAHNESVAVAQAHLQSTLDELRQRRKEDDAERQDLKAKAKTLEDQKRQAEGARREAEKRLKAIEAVRDGVQAKIATALGEIQDLKENMEMSEKHIKIVHDEGSRHLIETRKQIDDKTKELEALESEVAELESANDTLYQQVRQAEDKLKTAEAAAEDARKMAPEEEMMLMAAAYEAVASETYHLHGQRQNQADNQWASQAAAYMAEAGFPHLDQSYTARPATASTGYGHLSRAHGSNASYRSLNDNKGAAAANLPPISTNSAAAVPADKKLADVPGFEDFGPGTSRSLARPTTPHHHDDLEDIGSPSGPMSASFPDSWLPQGLVRSLEGDATPLEGASEVAPSDDEGIMVAAAPHQDTGSASPPDADSGSDSGGDSPYWPPQQHSDPGHRRVTPNSQQQRFFPNGTSPHMSGSTTTLPGIGGSNMGSLQSRRWFSTSPSSENVSSSFNLFNSQIPGVGSSDSLPLPGFESPFAPSASEKRALKWPLLGKARWGSNGNSSMSGLEEITAGLKDTAAQASSFGTSAPTNGLSAQELFNRVPPSAPSPTAPTGFGPWLSARNHFGNGHGHPGQGQGHGGRNHAMASGNAIGNPPAPGFNPAHEEDNMDVEGGLPTERKPSFRFFSLRKGAA